MVTWRVKLFWNYFGNYEFSGTRRIEKIRDKRLSERLIRKRNSVIQ